MDTVHFHPFPCYYYFFKELPQSDLIPTRLLHLVAPFYYSLIIIIVFTTKTAVFHRKINLCLLLIYNSYGLKSLYMYSKPVKHFYIFSFFVNVALDKMLKYSPVWALFCPLNPPWCKADGSAYGYLFQTGQLSAQLDCLLTYKQLYRLRAQCHAKIFKLERARSILTMHGVCLFFLIQFCDHSCTLQCINGSH